MTSPSLPVAGTSSKRALGTDPDLERLARQVRKAGGRVEVTHRTHVLWTLPDGTELRSGLTMSRRSIRNLTRDLRRRLGLQ